MYNNAVFDVGLNAFIKHIGLDRIYSVEVICHKKQIISIGYTNKSLSPHDLPHINNHLLDHNYLSKSKPAKRLDLIFLL